VPLYTITEIARVAIFVVPILSYIITKRICLGLQRKDLHLLEHGVETGIIRQLPSGEFIEETRPLDEEMYAKIARPEPLPLPPGQADAEAQVPAPGVRGGLGRVRTRLNKIVTESVPMNGHGANGHGPNGHGAAEDETGAVTVGSDEPDGAGEHH
jgi:ubiquinol-cytochrome c reductase cytochrome b subunit